jgi:uncharacterized membrane protein
VSSPFGFWLRKEPPLPGRLFLCGIGFGLGCFLCRQRKQHVGDMLGGLFVGFAGIAHAALYYLVKRLAHFFGEDWFSHHGAAFTLTPFAASTWRSNSVAALLRDAYGKFLARHSSSAFAVAIGIVTAVFMSCPFKA